MKEMESYSKELGAIDHLLHDGSHAGLSFVGSLLDILVGYLHNLAVHAQISNDADAKATNAAMACDDNLWDCAHADSVSSKAGKHAIFTWSFIRGTLCAQIHSVLDFDALLGSNLVGKFNEVCVVGFAHVRKTGAWRDVGTVERILWHEVDVVCDDHQVADAETGISATGSVADEKSLDAQLVHDADGKGHLFHGVTFIVMESPFHSYDILASEFSEYEFAFVALNGGNREIRYFLVGYDYFLLYFFRQAS